MQNTLYPYRVLFVEDEKEIRENYLIYLKAYFHEVFTAEDGEEAFFIYEKEKPHILILDIHIPKLSGIDLLKKIREKDHTTKAIMLTAHANIDYLLDIAGLKLTEYLVKPINRKKLNTALELIVSEISNFKTVSKNNISLKDKYSWDYDLKELSINNNLIHLTKKEILVFNLLISNPNKTFSIDEIIFEVWHNHDEGSTAALKSIIKCLRKKLPQNIIKNVFATGYKLEI